jgi:hypothetical protein
VKVCAAEGLIFSQALGAPDVRIGVTSGHHERRYRTSVTELAVSEAVGLAGSLEMATANAKSQEPAPQGIGEKSRQIS